MSEERYYDIIRFPVVTEKSTAMSEQNKVLFKVPVDADKQTIKAAIEKLFKVKVTAVNTINVQGKTKRFRGYKGRRSDYKKAIITLKEGEKIDVMGGV